MRMVMGLFVGAVAFRCFRIGRRLVLGCNAFLRYFWQVGGLADEKQATRENRFEEAVRLRCVQLLAVQHLDDGRDGEVLEGLDGSPHQNGEKRVR